MTDQPPPCPHGRPDNVRCSICAGDAGPAPASPTRRMLEQLLEAAEAERVGRALTLEDAQRDWETANENVIDLEVALADLTRLEKAAEVTP